MNDRTSGLLTGIVVALIATIIAAGSVTVASPGSLAQVESGPTPSATVTAQASPTTLPPTATPTLPPTAAPQASPIAGSTPETPTPVPSPTPSASTEVTIGFSVEGRPITAHRIGQGPIKVVLVGAIHGAYEANTYALVSELLAHFEAHPDEVPPEISLWLVPVANPDGLATDHRWNARDVDLNRNADTDLDGCGGNDWSPNTVGYEGAHPGAGGAYPFSEPETQALRDFMDDAWIAVFYHSAAEAIYVDTCQRHLPTARLAQALSQGAGYPVPEEGWSGYRITGDVGDYLAGEGVASVTVELTDHQATEFERNLDGVHALLAGASDIIAAEATETGAEYIWLDNEHVGQWRYGENSFIHPLALEVVGDIAYLLDGGRVLSLPLDQAAAPRLLLSPGDEVEGVRVLEPLDLASDGDSLLALDRAGDVYRYEPVAGVWSMERYDRPAGNTYDHYYVALAGTHGAGYLLETTHEQVWRFPAGQKGSAWIKLPQGRDVDVSANKNSLYVLTRQMNNPLAQLWRYVDGRGDAAFSPNVTLMHPRQAVATEEVVYVLDRAGRRLLALDPESGELQSLHQFPDRREVSALWADPACGRLVLAGRDTLYFVGQPEQTATVSGGPQLAGPQPHDIKLLESLRGLQVPIEGARITSRDFQTPGAPRHYRLGVHEGLDFYGHTVGVTVNRQTEVHAVADGVVIRALLDYQPLTAAQAAAWDQQCLDLGYTPDDVLDGYRGRQVWIDHGNGLVSHYAHLGSIAPGIEEGSVVTQGQVIATVGNSGTPGSVSSQTYDVHLHLELWIGDHYAGQFLRPIEAREWIEKILR